GLPEAIVNVGSSAADVGANGFLGVHAVSIGVVRGTRSIGAHTEILGSTAVFRCFPTADDEADAVFLVSGRARTITDDLERARLLVHAEAIRSSRSRGVGSPGGAPSDRNGMGEMFVCASNVSRS